MGMKLTYLLLEFEVLLLRVDEVQDDVECAGKDEREEKTETSQVDISLSAKWIN